MAAAGAGVGCTPDRLRPGPPSLVVEGPEGSTAFSPDTIAIAIFAQDDNGLDSLTVTVGDRTEDLDVFEDVEFSDILFWTIPEGLTPGELIDIVAYAKDLVGERTTVNTSVTVVARPAAGAARR
jgi:hypothetical protein